MKKQGNPYSVNCCRKCKKNLLITADLAGYHYCGECHYFMTIGVTTIEEYNKWLIKHNIK